MEFSCNVNQIIFPCYVNEIVLIICTLLWVGKTVFFFFNDIVRVTKIDLTCYDGFPYFSVGVSEF